MPGIDSTDCRRTSMAIDNVLMSSPAALGPGEFSLPRTNYEPSLLARVSQDSGMVKGAPVEERSGHWLRRQS